MEMGPFPMSIDKFGNSNENIDDCIEFIESALLRGTGAPSLHPIPLASFEISPFPLFKNVLSIHFLRSCAPLVLLLVVSNLPPVLYFFYVHMRISRIV